MLITLLHTRTGISLKELLERFSIECHNTKVITLDNYSGHKQSSEPIKTQSKYTMPAQSEGKSAWASHDWFCFTSDWLRKWRENFRPITKRRKAKPKQIRITFDTQMKIALGRFSL